MFMTTKTITIMEDAYELLKAEKQSNESFSEVIRRNIKKRKTIWDFVGILSDKEADELQEFVQKSRKTESKRMKELLRSM